MLTAATQEGSLGWTTVDTFLEIWNQCSATVKEQINVWNYYKRKNQSWKITVLLYKSILYLHLEWSVQFWALEKDREEMEKFQGEYQGEQRCDTLLYKEQCRRIGLLKLEKIWDVRHSTGKAMIPSVTQREWLKMECWLRLQDTTSSSRDQLTKLVEAKFQANRRKEFVMQQAVDLLSRSFPCLRRQGTYMLSQVFGGVPATGKPQQVQEVLWAENSWK